MRGAKIIREAFCSLSDDYKTSDNGILGFNILFEYRFAQVLDMFTDDLSRLINIKHISEITRHKFPSQN